jgi:Flp pilus assembly protein TadD
LSALFSLITVVEQPSVQHFPLPDRILNAVVSLVLYLRKTFWPDDLAIFYPFPTFIPVWHVIGAFLLINVVTFVVLVLVRRRPYLFVGWSVYFVTLLPVIGIVQVGNHAMADRYTYLPLIGVGIMLAWGVPMLFQKKASPKIILISSGVIFLVLLGILTWKQCSYWKNDKAIFSHALKVTHDNYLAHFCLGIALDKEGKNDEAISHCQKAIYIKSNYADGYNCIGAVYYKLGRYEKALENCKIAITLRPDHAESYYYEGLTYHRLKRFDGAVESYNQAIARQPDRADFYTARGNSHGELHQYKKAMLDFNRSIILKPDYADAYNGRGALHINNGQQDIGCGDLHKACAYGNCDILREAKKKGYCR